MMFERRREERFVLPSQEVAVMGIHSHPVGVLKDISKGGMKFEYFSNEPATDQWGMIDILSNQKEHVLLASVPCHIAYDIKDMVSDRTFTGLCVRICGVSFGPLTDSQLIDLDQILAWQVRC
jgi:hypothetical protein